MSGNFADILSATPTTIETPKPLPVGEYIWLVTGQPKFDKSQKKGTPYVEFSCTCQQAMDSVDQAALAEAKGCQGKTRRLTFYTTDDAIYRLDEFLFKHLGFELGTMSRKEAIAQSAGRTFVGTIRHQPSDDGTRLYDNISNTAAL